MDKLKNMREQLKEKLTDISKMPADPKFNPEDGEVKGSSVISGEPEPSGNNVN